MMSDDKPRTKTKKEKSELAIKELEEAYKTYVNEEKVYGYCDEDFAYSAYGTVPGPKSWEWEYPEMNLPDDIIYSHKELEVGTLVQHEEGIGVVLKKVNLGITDESIQDLKESGIAISAISLDNIIGSWDFKHGYDNNFYSVAINGKIQKIFSIGWKLKDISKDK